jgi:hypothetical protein
MRAGAVALPGRGNGHAGRQPAATRADSSRSSALMVKAGSWQFPAGAGRWARQALSGTHATMEQRRSRSSNASAMAGLGGGTPTLESMSNKQHSIAHKQQHTFMLPSSARAGRLLTAFRPLSWRLSTSAQVHVHTLVCTALGVACSALSPQSPTGHPPVTRSVTPDRLRVPAAVCGVQRYGRQGGQKVSGRAAGRRGAGERSAAAWGEGLSLRSVERPAPPP